MDIPNYRSSHKIPTPSGGGIIFPLIGIPMLCLQGLYTSIFCIPISFIGFWDDIKYVSYKKRLICQIITCLVILINSPVHKLYLIDYNLFLISILSIVIIFFSVGIINLTNFADGIDGLLISNMIIIFFSYSVLSSTPIYPLIAMLFAFLLFNKSPAKLFMGDCGSTLLGAILVSLLYESRSLDLVFSILMISIPIFGDATWTLLKRLFYGDNIFKPHKLHLFQRLNQAGWSHNKITLLYSFFSLFLSFIRIFTNINILFISSFLIILIALFIDFKYAKTFKI